jgi:hypothetical protein
MRLIKPYILLVWKIVMVDEVRQWLHGLRRTDRDTLRQVSDALDLLAIRGSRARPANRRPDQGLEVAPLEGAAARVVGCE